MFQISELQSICDGHEGLPLKQITLAEGLQTHVGVVLPMTVSLPWVWWLLKLLWQLLRESKGNLGMLYNQHENAGDLTGLLKPHHVEFS